MPKRIYSYFFQFLILINLLSLSLSLIGSLSINVQAEETYKLPFRAGETWATDDDYGVHTDKYGVAFDFYATKNSSLEIVAPASGTLKKGSCEVNGSTWLELQTIGGDIFRFMHMDTSTITVKAGQTLQIKQGDYIGSVTGAGSYDNGDCQLSSDGAHLHFSWESKKCPLYIDGYTFSCEGLKDCPGVGIYRVNCNQKYLLEEYNSTNVTNSNYKNTFDQKFGLQVDTSLVLTVQRGETVNGAKVMFWTDKGIRAQKWSYFPETGEIKGLNNMCLDVNLKSEVVIWQCDLSSGQIWSIEPTGQIRRKGTGNCLTGVDGAKRGSYLFLTLCTERGQDLYTLDLYRKYYQNPEKPEQTISSSSKSSLSSVSSSTISSSITSSLDSSVSIQSSAQESSSSSEVSQESLQNDELLTNQNQASSQINESSSASLNQSLDDRFKLSNLNPDYLNKNLPVIMPLGGFGIVIIGIFFYKYGKNINVKKDS